MNFSGNVGKTTLARDLFKPRLTDYKLISVEEANEDGAGVIQPEHTLNRRE
jgi:hypothetical protein